MKSIMIICFLFAMATSITAQKSDQVEKFKAQKVAFITGKLGLTPAVAQKFWPVYNEFSLKKDSINNLKRTGRKDMRGKWQIMTPKQKEASVDFQIQQHLEEAKLDQIYHEKFKKILTIDQVSLLYKAEYEFKMRLIKQLNQNKTSLFQNDEKQIDLKVCISQKTEKTDDQAID